MTDDRADTEEVPPSPLERVESGPVPRWRRGFVQFRYEPNGLSLKSAARSIMIFGSLVPVFVATALLYRPHLRSLPALVVFLVLFVCVSTWNLCELRAQIEGRFDWFVPRNAVTGVSAAIVEFAVLGIAFGIHGGVMLLLPSTFFLVAVLLGNLGMQLVAWLVLVAAMAVETGVQVPALDAAWLTGLFAVTAAVIGLVMDNALSDSLHGVTVSQSLALLASYAGTLRAWPEDLVPIAPRLAEALDVDRYAVLTRQGDAFQTVLSWPDADWPGADALGDLAERAADEGRWTASAEVVATPSSVGGIDVVLVVPAQSAQHVPVDHDYLGAGAALLAAMCDRARLISGLVDLANTDELTGIANRRRLFYALDRELSRGRRSGKVFSVAILDLDDFKLYNDTNGHSAGDRMLARFSQGIARRIRSQDFLARYGGEEFCLLLPETDGDGATRLLEHIRAQMTSEEAPATITFSAGVAAWDGTEDIDSLLLRADTNLYAAKSAGRNRVVGTA